MIRPTRTFLLGMLAGIPIALLTIFYEPMWMIWVGYVGVWCTLGGMDLLLAPGKRQLEVSLQAPSLMHLGEPTQVQMSVRSGSKSGARIELLLGDPLHAALRAAGRRATGNDLLRDLCARC